MGDMEVVSLAQRSPYPWRRIPSFIPHSMLAGNLITSADMRTKIVCSCRESSRDSLVVQPASWSLLAPAFNRRCKETCMLLFSCFCPAEVYTHCVGFSLTRKVHENIPPVSHIGAVLEAMIHGAGLRTRAWS
jgi:hypothetical protein